MHVMVFFDQTLGFPSMHAALLKPHRLAAWLEAASKLAMPECKKLLASVGMLVSPEPPFFPPETPATGPGRVSDQKWRAGAGQLQREVSAVYLHLNGPVAFTGTGAMAVGQRLWWGLALWLRSLERRELGASCSRENNKCPAPYTVILTSRMCYAAAALLTSFVQALQAAMQLPLCLPFTRSSQTDPRPSMAVSHARHPDCRPALHDCHARLTSADCCSVLRGCCVHAQH
jgi:hypothetical protein